MCKNLIEIDKQIKQFSLLLTYIHIRKKNCPIHFYVKCFKYTCKTETEFFTFVNGGERAKN